MRSEVANILRSSLGRPSASVLDERPCKMCQRTSVYFGSVDFTKNCENARLPASGISVDYYKCLECDFMFTDFCDSWTSADFVEFIYNEAYVTVDPEYRSIRGIRTAAHVLPGLESAGRHISLLDFGAGEAHFTRTLREAGFEHVTSFDPYAGGEEPQGQYDIVTAFEVIEHSGTPLETLDTLVSLTKADGCILIGQSMLPPNIEEIGVGWWYIAPRNGHISFYSHRSILRYAERNGLIYRSVGGDIILHRQTLSDEAQRFVRHFLPDTDIRVFTSIDVQDGTAGWHALERNGETCFRWTSRSVVPLGIIRLETRLTFVSIPVIMAATSEHWQGCSLQIGGSTFPLFRMGNSLCAQFTPSDAGIEYVSLVTASPVRPSDQGGSEDCRPLGLAVVVNDTQAI